jgi:hypothetical protein
VENNTEMEEPTACEKRWEGILASFQNNLNKLTGKHPECVEDIKTLHAGLVTVGQLIQSSPRANGNGAEWKSIITRTEEEKTVLCKHVEEQALFSGMLRLYATTHRELGNSLMQEPSVVTERDPAQSTEEFREQKGRKRTPTDEKVENQKKTKAAPTPRNPKIQPQGQVSTKNFFAPLRTKDMEMEYPVVDGAAEIADGEQQKSPSQSGRPPRIILTSVVNLKHLQKQLKGVINDSFEFRKTRNGTRVVTRILADFHSVKSFFDSQYFSYFTFSPKSDKPIKAVIRHLPLNTLAEEISDGLVDLGFDVVSVKQMTTTRRSSPEDPKITNLPLFLVTLPKTAKSHKNFRIPSLCHIAVKMEAYRDQNGLTQCHNCQQFGNVWANCKQPPRCLWCGGGHLHKECPEKDNASSTPVCCNCRLAEGKKPHPANYHSWSHAKEELQRNRSQKSPKTKAGSLFSSTLATPGVSFAAALRG